jgi:hypothetical protein
MWGVDVDSPKCDASTSGFVTIAERTPVDAQRPLALHDAVNLQRIARRAMLRRREGVLVQREREDVAEEREG